LVSGYSSLNLCCLDGSSRFVSNILQVYIFILQLNLISKIAYRIYYINRRRRRQRRQEAKIILYPSESVSTNSQITQQNQQPISISRSQSQMSLNQNINGHDYHIVNDNIGYLTTQNSRRSMDFNHVYSQVNNNNNNKEASYSQHNHHHRHGSTETDQRLSIRQQANETDNYSNVNIINIKKTTKKM
jgi:hypothetical protein